MLEFFLKINPNEFTSDFYGNRVYHWLKRETKVIDDFSGMSPILTAENGERFYVRLLAVSDYKKIIPLKDIVRKQSHFFYNLPVDVIGISEQQAEFIESCQIFLSHQISAYGRYYYAFLYREGTQWVLPRLSDRMKELKLTYQGDGLRSVNWRHRQVFTLAERLVNSLTELEKMGYVLHSMSQTSFFVTPLDGILLDFSDLLSFPELTNPGKSPIFIEYLYPNNWIRTAMEQANYSLTALLFHLLFSKFPYEQAEYPIIENDENRYRYKSAFDLYYKNLTFTFTEEQSVGWGLFIEDQEAFKAWESSPKKIQFIFKAILTEYYSEAPSPSQWQEYLKELKKEVFDG